VPDRPAVLHFDRLRTLAADLGGPGDALKFLDTYLGMLPRRLERIVHGILDRDGEAAADAILSLKVTSFMTGALNTEACCRELEQLVHEGEYDLALVSSGRLSAEVAALRRDSTRIRFAAHRELHAITACTAARWQDGKCDEQKPATHPRS
jgi:hypothetical protein